MITGHIVGKDSLNRSHRAAGIGVAFGDGDRVDTAVQNLCFSVESSPFLAEDRFELTLQLFGTEQSHDADVIQFGRSIRVHRDGL